MSHAEHPLLMHDLYTVAYSLYRKLPQIRALKKILSLFPCFPPLVAVLLLPFAARSPGILYKTESISTISVQFLSEILQNFVCRFLAHVWKGNSLHNLPKISTTFYLSQSLEWAGFLLPILLYFFLYLIFLPALFIPFFSLLKFFAVIFFGTVTFAVALIPLNACEPIFTAFLFLKVMFFSFAFL